MTTQPYKSLAEIMPTWRKQVLTGISVQRYKVGGGVFRYVPLIPGQIILIGAQPGAGKTCLVGGWVFNALVNHPDLKAVICNVEMPPDRLLNRELARVSGVPLDTIENGTFRISSDLVTQVKSGLATIGGLTDRVYFSDPNLNAACQTVATTGAGILVLDYIQRLTLGNGDMRQRITDTMDFIRKVAREYHTAVIVVSAVSRGSSREGAYQNMTLGSFRESSELEYGADDCYTLEQDGNIRLLRHLKARYSSTHDMRMTFQGEYQRFLPDGEGVNHE